MHSRLRKLLVSTLGLATVPAAQSRAQQADSTGTIVGLVVAAEGGVPLGYGMASIPVRGVERLANERGEFVFANIAAGTVELLVRRIGYTPARITTTVRPGAVDTVRVTLARLAVQLTAVHVSANRVCTHPGAPDPTVDPAFAAIFDQLEQNADAYRLLATTYPFTYDIERRSTIRYVGGDEIVQRLDTERLGTGMKWHYKPGEVVVADASPVNRQVIFNLPALIHFAEPAFLANHCFYSGGRETIAGSPALRVDFLAASRIKTPDVDGSMYIDPVTYQIRRSVLRLTRIPEETPQISSVTVTTDFRTVVASISIANVISSTHQLFADTTRPVLPFAVYETQRLLRVTFLNGAPPRP
jgi:hypothetical protein